jgi:hypothetical protein
MDTDEEVEPQMTQIAQMGRGEVDPCWGRRKVAGLRVKPWWCGARAPQGCGDEDQVGGDSRFSMADDCRMLWPCCFPHSW